MVCWGRSFRSQKQLEFFSRGRTRISEFGGKAAIACWCAAAHRCVWLCMSPAGPFPAAYAHRPGPYDRAGRSVNGRRRESRAPPAAAHIRGCRRYACICLCMSGRRSPRELADTREPGHRTWRRPAFTAQPRSHDACAQHSQALTRASPASQAWLKTLPVTPCHRWQARSCSRAVVAWLRP